MCSEGGQDASSKVDGLATALGRPLLQCAMGSAEGFVEADRHVAQGCRSGCWVLLRNVHLCPEWLALLEKKLPALTTGAHSGFRLFLACEISTALPASLLRNCEVSEHLYINLTHRNPLPCDHWSNDNHTAGCGGGGVNWREG